MSACLRTSYLDHCVTSHGNQSATLLALQLRKMIENLLKETKEDKSMANYSFVVTSFVVFESKLIQSSSNYSRIKQRVNSPQLSLHSASLPFHSIEPSDSLRVAGFDFHRTDRYVLISQLWTSLAHNEGSFNVQISTSTFIVRTEVSVFIISAFCNFCRRVYCIFYYRIFPIKRRARFFKTRPLWPGVYSGPGRRLLMKCIF